MVSLARKLRQVSWCVTVIVVSDDPVFLAAFAKWSLKGRLLVWSTRLLVVTRLQHSQMQRLFISHWTFSMMNSVILNNEESSALGRCIAYVHTPYSPVGSATKRVASWTTNRGLMLESSLTLFPEKYLNFYGGVVNVTALPYTPHWVEKQTTDSHGITTTKYSGTDYYLLATIAEVLNFTIHVLPTKSWDEVAQRVEERVSFMATVFHNVLPQRLGRYDYSYTYEYGSLDFSLAVPALRPQWQSLYYPLSDWVWLAILVTVLIIPQVVSALSRAEVWCGFDKGLTLGPASVVVTSTLLSQNLTRYFPSSNASRILITSWLVFAFIVGTVYRGNLTAALTLPKYPPRPETLQELVNTYDRITMPPFGVEFIKFFTQSDSTLYKALGERMTIVPSVIEGLRQAMEHKEAHVAGLRYMEQMIARHFSNPDGSPRMYVGRESLIPGIAAWPLPHDAPYRSQIDAIMMAVVEAGLYEKWSEDMLVEARRESRLKQRDVAASEVQVEGNTRALNMIHMQGAIFLLLLGLMAATLSFMIEKASFILLNRNPV